MVMPSGFGEPSGSEAKRSTRPRSHAAESSGTRAKQATRNKAAREIADISPPGRSLARPVCPPNAAASRRRSQKKNARLRKKSGVRAVTSYSGPACSSVVVIVVFMPAVIALLVRVPAFEVRSIVRAAAARIDGNLRVDAQRARAVDNSARAVRCDNPLWRLAFLDPVLERSQHVESIRTRTPGAVLHARHHEQPEEFVRPLERVLAIIVAMRYEVHHALEVVDRVKRRDVRVAEAVVHDQLRAAPVKRAQVRVDGVKRQP